MCFFKRPRPTVKWPPKVERWRSLVAQYFKPEDVDLALGIIRCESVGDPNAICEKEWIGTPPPGYDGSAGTRASGLFQHVPAYWPSRSKAAGFENASIFDPRANVATAAWLVYNGWHPETAPNWQHWAGGCLEWSRKQLKG